MRVGPLLALLKAPHCCQSAVVGVAVHPQPHRSARVEVKLMIKFFFFFLIVLFDTDAEYLDPE